jgi:hypothetical protein
MMFHELESLFIRQVKKDAKKFSDDCTYLRNPKISSRPAFCLVAMEPSLIKWTVEEMEDATSKGFINFLDSEEDFIVHYCAYRYLCNSSFAYHITDISKGAMHTAVARRNRAARYKEWLPLLDQELDLLGRPKVIALGIGTNKFLQEHKLSNLSGAVLHYSGRNGARFLVALHSAPEGKEPDALEEKLREFTKKLMVHCGYDTSRINDHLQKRFHRPLTDWKKGLFLTYRKRFLSFRKNG